MMKPADRAVRQNFRTISGASARYFLASTVFLCTWLVLPPSQAQGEGPAYSRRPLEHRDYDSWKTISSEKLSRDGKWAMYAVNRGQIDSESTLFVRQASSTNQFQIERGSNGRFSYDSRYAIFTVTPAKDLAKKLRKEKAKPEAFPKNKLQILQLVTGDVVSIDRVASFRLPEENADWIACRLEPPIRPDGVSQKKSDIRETYEITESGLQRPAKKLKLKSRNPIPPAETTKTPKGESAKVTNKEDDKASETDKDKPQGTTLILRNLATGIQHTYPDVVEFLFSKNGRMLAYTTSRDLDRAKKDSPEISDQPNASVHVDGVHLVDLHSMDHSQIISGSGQYKNLAFSDDGSKLALITNKDDDAAKFPIWSVYLWQKGQKKAERIASEGDKGIPEHWWVATNSNQRFSEDGRRLFFETAPVPEEVIEQRSRDENQKEEDADEEEQAKLDIWHWQDPLLQPQQLLQAEAERKRDYRAVYHTKAKRISQLATVQVPFVNIDYRSRSSRAIAVSDMAYQKTLSWEYPGFQDTYLVHLDSGKLERVQERVRWMSKLSPDGKYIFWFDADQRHWYSLPTSKGTEAIKMTAGIRHPLEDELHDRPSLPSAYGNAGWIDGDKALLIYDRYDIWQVDPTGQHAARRLTNGRENHIRYRYVQLDSKLRFIHHDQSIVLSAFNEKTKASGYCSLTIGRALWDGAPEENLAGNDASTGLKQLIMLPENVSGLRKAEESDDVLFTRSTFEMFPDLWASTLGFKAIDRLSDVNPQQDEISWGTAQLTRWTATDGQKLDGILYRPDGFDPSKKYPMLVYFYERNSDRLHRHYVPEAGRASINISFYVSRGYVVFVPDIPYKTGEPGNSAVNAVLSGVKSVIDMGFVDEKRIGMQGHSWGGYQTAYLATQTDLFACAESGAPVSNMTSAYGGIRWSSGRSRMFQYERTQSRIGEDLWAARDKYIANSPLFFADQIKTPLLILHNDDDGAVPWYQGIELFVALRRLEKPAWMLNYNNNPHGIDGQSNRRDFAIRMQQFFDHYLKDAPEPEWMAVGVPAVKKGKEFGLELLEPKIKAED